MVDALYQSFNQDFLPALAKQEAHRGTSETVRTLLKGGEFWIQEEIQDEFIFRYVDAQALLNHSLTIWFLDGWRKVIPDDLEDQVFTALERKLDKLAQEKGELTMRIPRLYVRATKPE